MAQSTFRLVEASLSLLRNEEDGKKFVLKAKNNHVAEIRP